MFIFILFLATPLSFHVISFHSISVSMSLPFLSILFHSTHSFISLSHCACWRNFSAVAGSEADLQGVEEVRRSCDLVVTHFPEHGTAIGPPTLTPETDRLIRPPN